MGYYNTGTVTVANGATAVVGVGTNFSAYVQAGDMFTAAGMGVRVASVTDATHLALAYGWPGTGLNGAPYEVQIMPSGSSLAASVRSVLDGLQSGALQNVSGGALLKADPSTPMFYKTGAGTISVKAGSVIGLNASTFTFSMDTAVQMPSLSAGTDYAVYMCSDGNLHADANFSYPTGFSPATSRQIGGFHYAPGGNAAAQAGGDTTPAINPYSIWDLKFRPLAPDPRGMALILNRFWSDIYLCNITPEANGTSRYNMTIADGSSPPKKPTAFGGDGNAAYGSFTWWEAAEVMSAAGKQLLAYDEFAAAMYGTTEGSSGGTDPGSTILRAAYTSKFGIMLASGNTWVWGRDFSYWPGSNGAGWKDNAGARGQLYLANDQGLVAALFGGDWDNGGNAGSRSSDWIYYPWGSSSNIGARGRCDHLRLV